MPWRRRFRPPRAERAPRGRTPRRPYCSGVRGPRARLRRPGRPALSRWGDPARAVPPPKPWGLLPDRRPAPGAPPEARSVRHRTRNGGTPTRPRRPPPAATAPPKCPAPHRPPHSRTAHCRARLLWAVRHLAVRLRTAHRRAARPARQPDGSPSPYPRPVRRSLGTTAPPVRAPERQRHRASFRAGRRAGAAPEPLRRARPPRRPPAGPRRRSAPPDRARHGRPTVPYGAAEPPAIRRCAGQRAYRCRRARRWSADAPRPGGVRRPGRTREHRRGQRRNAPPTAHRRPSPAARLPLPPAPPPIPAWAAGTQRYRGRRWRQQQRRGGLPGPPRAVCRPDPEHCVRAARWGARSGTRTAVSGPSPRPPRPVRWSRQPWRPEPRPRSQPSRRSWQRWALRPGHRPG